MERYEVLSEDATWRDAFDAINTTSENLNNVDYLYKSYLGDGQVFDPAGNIGYVNAQEALRNTNIVIPKENIASFMISGFKFYHRKQNKIVDIEIDCNLYDYRDGRIHFLYIVLSQRGKYEVHDSMFENTEDLCLFARFVLDTEGNTVQFYVMAPFAGSPDYIKGNTFYDVSEGMDLVYFNEENKQFTITNSRVKFSGINFDSYASPDVLNIEPPELNIKFKYVDWDSLYAIPRPMWLQDDEVNSPITEAIMNYDDGTITQIDENKFTIQKVYYDIYTKKFIAMLGNRAYDTMQDAVVSAETVLKYPKPDGVDYLLPIAVLILKNTNAIYSDETIRIIGLTYDETELFDSNDLARQQSLEALTRAQHAIDVADSAVTNVNNHASNRSNPHQTTAQQVGLGNVGNYGIATEAEAKQGTINTKYMTPLRTVDTITAKSIITDGDIILKISNTQPAAQAGKTIIWINTSS